MKILAVDDDEIALELLTESLKSVGYSDITVATSGLSALEEIDAATRPFDYFLLDIQMPEMDGIELCQRIRRMASYKTSPIIMITAMSDRSFVDAAFSAGATDYVTKPFDTLELSARVRMAENLVRETRVSTNNVFAVQSLKAKVEDALRFSIGDAITIEDVPGMIGKLAMENYLLQLSRGKVYQSIAIGFAIVEIETIFSRSSPTEMLYTLTDVADAIADSLKQSNYLLTYCGSGKFVCVADRGSRAISPDLEIAIQLSIEEMEIAYDSGAPCEITIAMGEPVTSSLWSSGNATQLMESALISAEDKRRALQLEAAGVSVSKTKKGFMKAG
ncbi:response regulator [Pseudohalocynthiibacter aestuariivivens]|jgi:CheY-like chemotaxis protein|uniref:Response regulator n=1 Tax=Pseudohalocynthiibacter aestuariivivens TaxID=1591409 RepID=A0ABV5JFI1_9RHOB|nr:MULTISPECIES: response regulator [Pseudohalocynthiibacter]MBS9716443.1 response regulator [Pseudohalocynthiibacter aestuariivivens]MCK0100748.1 response regulator [Pseudohalocynthiibacter sp. F2068]